MTRKMTNTSTTTRKASTAFTAEERAAAKAHAQELKAAARGADGEKAVLAAIAAMTGSDRVIGERLHAIITANAPSLTPKTWYGMPAYAKDDKVVCFFRNAQKFKDRYATFGFNDAATLDDGGMWPTVFALTRLTPTEEAKIVSLLKRAVS